jgi:hypothetical protein
VRQPFHLYHQRPAQLVCLTLVVALAPFDLFYISSVLATKLRVRPAQIVCPDVLDSNLLGRLLDDRPDRLTEVIPEVRK